MLDTTQVILVGFALFAVKHFLCDFPLQSMKMIQYKGVYGLWPGITHSLVHGIGTAIVLSIVISDPVLIVILAVLDFIVHYHVDWTKQWISSKNNYTPSESKFWTLLGLDQLFHYLTYIVILSVIVS